MASIRPIPRFDEVELTFIANLFYRKEHIHEVLSTVEPSDLATPHHRSIYEAIVDLMKTQGTYDLVSVSQWLRQHDLYDKSAPYIANTIKNHEDISVSLAYLSERIALYSRQRKILSIMEDTKAKIYKGEDGAQDYLNASLLAMHEQRRSDNTYTATELQSKIYEAITTKSQLKQAIPFGFRDVDRVTGGALPGQLIVIAARPSVGKSAFLLNVAQNMIESGKSIYYASIESSWEEVTRRLIARHSGVSHSGMFAANLAGEALARVNEQIGSLERYKFVLNDDPHNTTQKILAKAMQIKATVGLDALFVDYLQILKDPALKGENRWERVGRISMALKTVARVLDVPMIVACQLNREGDPNQPPSMKNMAESGQIERDADVILGMWRKDDKQPYVSFRVLKQRDGERGDIIMGFDGSLCKFQDFNR